MQVLLAAVVGAAAVVGLLLSTDSLVSDEARDGGHTFAAIAGIVLGALGVVLAGVVAWRSQAQPAPMDLALFMDSFRRMQMATEHLPPEQKRELWRELLEEGRAIEQRLVDEGLTEEAAHFRQFLVDIQRRIWFGVDD